MRYLRARRQQEQASPPGGGVCLPGGMANELQPVEIVHAGASQAPVRPDEAAGLDHVDGDAEAGGEGQDGTGVMRAEIGRASCGDRVCQYVLYGGVGET